MGQCGCCDFNPDYVFPGPDKTFYALQIDPGCRYCDRHTISVIVSQLPKDEAIEWGLVDEATAPLTPSLPFRDVDSMKEAVLPVFNPKYLSENLKKELKPFLEECPEEILELFDEGSESRNALEEAVKESFYKTIKASPEDNDL